MKDLYRSNTYRSTFEICNSVIGDKEAVVNNRWSIQNN